MALDDYVTLAELKKWLGNMTKTTADEALGKSIKAASRSIDKMTGRYFGKDDAVSVREYSTRHQLVTDADGARLLIDDVADDTGFLLNGSALASPYSLGPPGSIAAGKPATYIRIGEASSWLPGLVQVSAVWGYPSVPDDIAQACLIQAARLYKRSETPEGVLGNAEWGAIRVGRVDPDVMALIQPYVIPGIG